MSDYKLNDSVYLMFTTRAFATGIPGTLSASTVAVYEDVTATPILTAVAVTEDLNSKVGLNACTIAATSGNGFNAGGHYHVVIEAGTVDSVSVVGEIVGSFTIAASAAAQDLANGTDGLGAIKAQTANIEADTQDLQTQVGTAGAGLTGIAAVGDVTNLSNLPTIPTNWITASGINADALTAAKIADNAFSNEHFAAGALTATEITSSAGAAVTSIASDVITSTSIQAGAITSSEIADGAITAAKITALSTAGWTALDDQYDGATGLVGDLYPATQLQMGGLTSGTAAINTVAASFNSTVGGTPTNAYTDTHSENTVYHIVPPTGSDTDIEYTFDVGGNGVPVAVTWVGYATSNGDSYSVWAWNYTGTPAWEQIGTIIGTNSTSPVTNTYSLTNQHVGTGASIGEVKFRFLSADGTNIATDRLLCSYAVVAQSVGYADGAIWIDSNGTTGAVDYVNGTADNPCPYANAKTISASLGITRFHVVNGDTVTLDASAANWTMLGESWTLALGNQSIAAAYFSGASVSGISSGAAPTFNDCEITNSTSTTAGKFINCGFSCASGTPYLAVAGTGEYVMTGCYSKVAGSGAPYFDFSPATGTMGINNRGWFGGAHYTLDSNCTLSHEVVGGGGTTVVTGGGSVEIRGLCRAITTTLSGSETVQIIANTGDITIDGAGVGSTVSIWGTHSDVTNTATGSPTITDDGLDTAQVTSDTAAILVDTADMQPRVVEIEVDTGTTLDGKIDTIAADVVNIDGIVPASAADLATVDTVVDNLNLGIIYGLVEAGTLALGSCTTNLAGYANDQLIGRVIVFTSGTSEGEATEITDYASASGLITYTTLIVAPEAGDAFKVI